MRDVLLVMRERVLQVLREPAPPAFTPMGRDERVEHDRYAEQSPIDVARQIEDAAAMLAFVLEGLDDEQWARRCIYNYPTPAERTLSWVAQHTIHEADHHLRDLEASLSAGGPSRRRRQQSAEPDQTVAGSSATPGGTCAGGGLPAHSGNSGAQHLGDTEANASCGRPQQGVGPREPGVGGIERRIGGASLRMAPYAVLMSFLASSPPSMPVMVETSFHNRSRPIVSGTRRKSTPRTYPRRPARRDAQRHAVLDAESLRSILGRYARRGGLLAREGVCLSLPWCSFSVWRERRASRRRPR